LEESNGKVKPVSLAEVKSLLTNASKEREELLYEQKIALEHAQKLGKLSVKKTEELIGELKKLEFLEINHVYKIADLLPLTEEEITAIFAKQKITVKDENAKKIIDIVTKYYLK